MKSINYFNNISVSPYLLARHDLTAWCMLVNNEIDPQYDYCDKFFSILNYEFNRFLTAPERLMILEAPPRTGKTDFDLNVFLCWLIGTLKKKRIMIAVSNKRLMRQVRKKIERIVRSPLYSKVFPELCITTCNESYISLNNDVEIEIMTSFSQSPIGVGYHWVFLIDFISGEMLNSKAQKATIYDNLRFILTRKQNDPATKILVDNQRLGLDDLSAYFVESYAQTNKPYIRNTFPFLFEEKYVHPTDIGPIVFEQGEFLVERFNYEEKQSIISDVGSFMFETQYQQKPRRPEGDLVKREMFRFYTLEDLKSRETIKGFITTDLGLKGGKKNDYTVFIFWLIDADGNLYLVDMVRKQIKGYLAEKLLYNFYLKWQDGLKNGGAGCDFITIESVPGSELTIQRLQNGFHIDGKLIQLGSTIKSLPRSKNKFSRFKATVPFIESGKFFLPSHEVKIDGTPDVGDKIVEPLILEYENMREDDSHDHDDIVDCGNDAIQETIRKSIDLSTSFI